MRLFVWVLATLVSAGASLGQPASTTPAASQTESDQTPEDGTPAGETSAVGTDELPAPAPPKPPDGLLPVAELSRLDFSPRDRPKALLYGTHLLIVGSTGFVEGHDAAAGEFAWKLGLPGEQLFDPVVFEAGPLVDGETDAFTVVLSEPSGHVLLVDGLTGAIRQETRLPFELALPPIRGPEDIVFFATPSGDILSYDVRMKEVVFQTATGETPMALSSTETLLVVSGGDQHLTAIDLPSGTIRWTFRGRAGFYAPAAFDPDATRVYVGDDTGEIYALDASDASVKFRWSTGAAIRNRGLVENERLYLATWANTLFAFNAETGDEHWRANLPGRPATPPMRVRNRLLVGTYDGVLIEINPARGQLGKQFVAPGEIVFAPSFFLARPSPEELAAAEALDLDAALDDDAALDEDDLMRELDPRIFGPEEIDPSLSEDVAALDDEGTADPDAVAPVVLPAEPLWFERSRIAMVLRSGQVLLLGHQVPRAVPDETEPGEGEQPLPTPPPPTSSAEPGPSN